MAEQTKLRVAGEGDKVLVRAIGFDTNLCLRESVKGSSCTRCSDICPGNALRIASSTKVAGDGSVTISKGFCVDCGLCAAVCRTGAINILEPNLRAIRRRLAKANLTLDLDEHGERVGHVYLTCVETGLAKSDPSVVEVACLGQLTWEMWTNLMLEFPNLAVYLPSDLCERCKAKRALDMIVDEVCHAQDVVGRDLLLIETMRELDFTTSNGSLKPDRRAKMLDAEGDSFGSIIQDMTSGKVNEDDLLTEDMGPHDSKKMRLRIKKELTDAEGENTPGIVGSDDLGGTLTHARWALFDAAMRHPEIAPRAELTYADIARDAEPATVATCAASCPLGAIRTSGSVEAGDFSFTVRPAFCTNCGLCADIFAAAAPADAGAQAASPVRERTIAVSELLAR